MTLVNIKCPHCGSEGHTDDENSRSRVSSRREELLYGNCKDCGKDFLWNTYCDTPNCTKVEHTYDAEQRGEALHMIKKLSEQGLDDDEIRSKLEESK